MGLETKAVHAFGVRFTVWLRGRKFHSPEGISDLPGP